MNQFAKYANDVKHVKHNRQAAAMLATMFFTFAGFANASAASDEQSLRRGSVEDMSPQQKYQSAIREAGGAYKAALRECVQGARDDDRSRCTREAKATYDSDMTQARLILK